MLAAGFTDGHIIVHSLATKSTKIIMRDSVNPITSLRWTPHTEQFSKNILLTINTEGDIIYWHVNSGKILHKIQENATTLCLDYNTDGSLFAIGREDKKIKIYDENMKSEIYTFLQGYSYRKGHQSRVNSICFHKNNNFKNIFASGGWDQSVYLYDTRTNKITGNVLGPYICGDSIDLKDYYLLTGSYFTKSQIQLWDIRTHKFIKNINWDSSYDENNKYETNIYSAQFSKGKRDLIGVGSSKSNEFRLFEMEKYSPYAGTKFLEKPIYSLDFSNNGQYVAISGADANIRIFKL